jgi:diguanylate cyclase (GGDEF)-like protein
MEERYISLIRAAVLFFITLLFRVKILQPVSLINFDWLLAVGCFLTLLNIYLPFKGKISSFIFHIFYLFLIYGLSYYTDGRKSFLNYLYFLEIANISLRYEIIWGIFSATFVSILYLFFPYPDRILSNFFIFNNIFFYYGSVIFLNYLKELKEKGKLKKEIDSLKERIKELEEDSAHLKIQLKKETIEDKLTELHNLKYFMLRVTEEIAQAKRHKLNFSVVVLGVDNLKLFNSTYGEKAGDEVLKRMGILLKAYMRNSDLIARYDNTDKFLIIFPFTKGEQALIPVQRFQEAVSRYRFYEKDPSVTLTVSAGISAYPEDGENERILLEKAEAALRRSKVSGKNKVTLFSKDLVE